MESPPGSAALGRAAPEPHGKPVGNNQKDPIK
jgi:hypothetical protein